MLRRRARASLRRTTTLSGAATTIMSLPCHRWQNPSSVQHEAFSVEKRNSRVTHWFFSVPSNFFSVVATTHYIYYVAHFWSLGLKKKRIWGGIWHCGRRKERESKGLGVWHRKKHSQVLFWGCFCVTMLSLLASVFAASTWLYSVPLLLLWYQWSCLIQSTFKILISNKLYGLCHIPYTRLTRCIFSFPFIAKYASFTHNFIQRVTWIYMHYKRRSIRYYITWAFSYFLTYFKRYLYFIFLLI